MNEAGNLKHGLVKIKHGFQGGTTIMAHHAKETGEVKKKVGCDVY
jgi:hypothetical protein